MERSDPSRPEVGSNLRLISNQSSRKTATEVVSDEMVGSSHKQ